MSGPNDGKGRETWSYVIGYVLALALTGVAFAAVRWPSFAATTTLAIVFGMALVQIIVHFRFFLHISLANPSSRIRPAPMLFSAGGEPISI